MAKKAVKKAVNKQVTYTLSQDLAYARLITACNDFLKAYTELSKGLINTRSKTVGESINTAGGDSIYKQKNYIERLEALKKEYANESETSARTTFKLLNQLYLTYMGKDKNNRKRQVQAFEIEGLYQKVHSFHEALDAYFQREILFAFVDGEGKMLILENSNEKVADLYSGNKTISSEKINDLRAISSQNLISGLDAFKKYIDLNDKEKEQHFKRAKAQIEINIARKRPYYQIVLARGNDYKNSKTNKQQAIFRPYYYQNSLRKYNPDKHLNIGHYAEHYAEWVFKNEDVRRLPPLQAIAPTEDKKNGEIFLGEFIHSTGRDQVPASAKGDILFDLFNDAKLTNRKLEGAVKSLSSSFSLEGWKQYVILAQNIITAFNMGQRLEANVSPEIIESLTKRMYVENSRVLAKKIQQGVKNK